MTNHEMLVAVSNAAPEFKRLIAKNVADEFSEAGFEALSRIPTMNGEDPVTRFYSVALLVSKQWVHIPEYKDALASIGIMEKYGVGYGNYQQDTFVDELPSLDPLPFGPDGHGLQNGQQLIPEVNKATVEQYYYGKNKNYFNFVSLQNWDLRRGFLNEGGIDEIVGAIYARVYENRARTEYAWFFEVLSGAINSIDHPLQDTQKVELSSWTDAAPTDAEVREMIEVVKNIAESVENVPSCTLYNAAAYPSAMDPSKMVILCRNGLRSKIESLLGYVYNESKLTFPYTIKSVPNFGGLIPALADGTKLQPVYERLGRVVGYLPLEDCTVNGRATKVNGHWTVNATIDGTTADVALNEAGYEGVKAPKEIDPNENVLLCICEKGLVFEMVEEELQVETERYALYRLSNVVFSQLNNGINYAFNKNLITVSKPSA